jgi:hypothetical protein
MGAARSDPGGGEIPMKVYRNRLLYARRADRSPVRGVVDKYDDAKRLNKITGWSVFEKMLTGLLLTRRLPS